MESLICLAIGAAIGAVGLWYWQRRRAQKSAGPVVKPQGGGGPGEEGP